MPPNRKRQVDSTQRAEQWNLSVGAASHVLYMSLGFAPSMLRLGMPDFLRSNLQLRMSSLLLLLRSFALSELSLGAPAPAPAVHPLAGHARPSAASPLADRLCPARPPPGPVMHAPSAAPLRTALAPSTFFTCTRIGGASSIRIVPHVTLQRS